MRDINRIPLPPGKWFAIYNVKKRGRGVATIGYNPISETPYQIEPRPWYFKTASEVREFCELHGLTIHNYYTGEEVGDSEL
jgi:hypothetical protein